MSKPFVRTHAQGSVDLPQLPADTLGHLVNNLPDEYTLIYDDADADDIVFELRREDDSVRMMGNIKRWHGTESQLQYRGEVDVPAQVSLLRKVIFGLLIGVPTIIWLWILIIPWISVLWSEINGVRVIVGVANPVAAATTSLIFSLVYTIFVTFIIGLLGKYFLLKDGNVKKRWQRQQDLGMLVNLMNTLPAQTHNTSRLEMTDETENTLSDVATPQSRLATNR